MRIAVDAMGGDYAPGAMAAGALQAARDGVPVTLVGDDVAVGAAIDAAGGGDSLLRVVHAPDAVDMDDPNPAATVRARDGLSISLCMGLVRRGEADAVVTMGHTGAGLAAALLRLGRLPGVRRPALAAPFPTRHGMCVLLDVGANVDVKPLHLFQFSVMGAAYAKGVLGVAEPRVGLVSIGEEAGKGSRRIQEAWPLLESSNLNFVGNIEGRDIPSGDVDVAVVDGFTGNVVIKFAEGLSGLVVDILRESATGDPLGLVGGHARAWLGSNPRCVATATTRPVRSA